jgi:hypothetical protein
MRPSALKDKVRLRIFQKKALRRISGPTGGEVTGVEKTE